MIGMHELDRDVLRVGGVGSAAEGQQPAAAEEAVGHFAAGEREAVRFAREELFEDPVALQELFFDRGRQIARSVALS